MLHAETDVGLAEMKQFTYRLCGLYQTCAGILATPSPLKYSVKPREHLAGIEGCMFGDDEGREGDLLRKLQV